MSNLAMYMENIDEFVNDENRIVTYKWLSIELGISCYLSQRLLCTYVHQNENNKKENLLHIVYVIVGIQEDEKGPHRKVLLVREKELKTAQDSFSRIESIGVYSVSKSAIKDLASILYTTDYDCVKNNFDTFTKYGAITRPDVKLRLDAEVANLRTEATLSSSPLPESKEAAYSKLVKDEKPKTYNNNCKPGSDISIANMHEAQENHSKADASEETKFKKEDKTKTNTKCKAPVAKKISGNKSASSNARISGFFIKKSSVCEEEVQPETCSNKEVVCNDKVPLLATDEVPRGFSPKRAKSKKLIATKRSRILQIDSSDSESEHSGDESPVDDEEQIPEQGKAPPSDDNEETVVSAAVQRGKKRKLVETTYEDEDGFFVTKKEYKDVTDSEPEVLESPPSKKQSVGSNSLLDTQRKSPAQKKVTSTDENGTERGKIARKKELTKKKSNGQTKQASIMNFFKKQ